MIGGRDMEDTIKIFEDFDLERDKEKKRELTKRVLLSDETTPE